MTIVYELIKENRELDGSSYMAYGIAARTGNHQVLCCVQDISTDRQPVDDLVNLCNTMQLLPEHLFDVVADWIGS